MNTQEPAKLSVSEVRWLYLGGKRTMLIAGGCFLVGLVLLRIGFSFWSSARQARQATVTTSAQIVDKGQRSEKQKVAADEPKSPYWLSYRYRDTSGRSHQGRISLEQREWNKFEKYDDILIDYERERPEESQLAAVPTITGRWIMMMSLTLGGILYAAGCVWGFGGWVWATRKARRVLRGTPVLGEVTQRASPFWARLVAPPRSRLRFEFLDAHGRPRRGKTHWLPEDVVCYWNQGDSILVLCDPEQPERPEADVFQIRPDDKERLMTDGRPLAALASSETYR
ncbi:MAG TPA: DUF3592 domain-containing protein [Gemmataceae bacterium]|jgi:hypothetical protein|nr:DUF3592 domain-containing protein [Gemmataceae bacterium]